MHSLLNAVGYGAKCRKFSKAIGVFCCGAESLCYGARSNNNS